MVQSIYAPADEKRLDFENWKQVPEEFKTRNQWLREGRKVKDGEKSKARVVYPRIVEAHYPFPVWDEFLLEQQDDFLLLTDPPTPLFHVDQTRPYSATPRTKAYEVFDDIFLLHSRKDSYGLKTDLDSGNELDSWYTETADPYAQRIFDRHFLTSQLIRQHINQAQIVGVKGTDLTRFIMIDLDYHERDLGVFEAQAGVLLDTFHGKGCCHFQIKHQDVTGLQLLLVFPEPRELEVFTDMLETLLKKLDRQNPELAQRATAAGMKSLAELEIYPDPNQAVRLPLCRDRQMLLDKPMGLVTHRNRQVQDVEKYVSWLEDPNRHYMTKEQVLDYLHYFAKPGHVQTKKQSKATAKPVENSEIITKGWKGKLRSWIPQFWIEGEANGHSFNEHITVLSRLAACYGHTEWEIARSIKRFVDDLPACAKSCSSRLLKGKLRSIDNVIETTAKYACQKNGHQQEADLSTKKLKAVLAKWPGFDPLNKSTWGDLAPRPQSNVTPNWTEEQKSAICAYLRRPLFVKDDELILRFVNGIVNLTIDKEAEGNGWHKDYLKTWMNEKFRDINCGKAQKRQRILVALQELRIIFPRFKGVEGVCTTHWTLGEMARQATA